MVQVSLTAGQIAALHPDDGSRAFGSQWPALVKWARSLLCPRCSWYCRDRADCDLNLDLAADGVAPQHFDNVPPITA